MMKKFIITLLCCACIVQVISAVPNTSPVNSDATSTTRAILTYLYELEGTSILTGQFGMFGSQTTPATSEAQLDAIHQLSGLYPGLTGADFNTPGKPPSQRIPEVVEWLTQKWNEGYLVMASWHAPNPCGGSYSWNPADPPFDISRVLPGGACRSAHLAQLDQIVAGLATLQQRGVTVLWRPWHEQNGSWFWWGNLSQSQFTALWVDMFNYFVQVKGLNNLLWVFSPNTPWDQWAVRADALYPGDPYVDIVGLDEYMSISEMTLNLGWGSNPDSNEAQSGYLQLADIPKPMILAEFGPIPASGAGYDTKTYNWSNLVDDLHRKYPRIVAFQAWEYVWQIGRGIHIGQSAMMHHPRSITRDALPNFGSTDPTPTPTQLPTVTPQPTTLDISVRLQGRPNEPSTQNIVEYDVTFTSTSGGSITTSIVTNQAGTVTLSIHLPPGIYTARVTNSIALAAVQTINVTTGSITIDFGMLRVGDADNDNAVSLADFSILAASFGTQSFDQGYDSRTDFNGDGFVSIADFSLLSSNFGQAGQ